LSKGLKALTFHFSSVVFFMTDFLTFQLPFVAALQHLLAAFPFMVAIWQVVSLLGNEEFFLFLVPLVYWCVSAKRGLQLGVLIIGGDAINALLKLLMAAPRPYWFGEPIRALSQDASFGLPSSHAQNAFAVWAFVAMVVAPRYGKARCYEAAAVLIVLIAFSRVVLGVHFPSDILVGWGLGFLWLRLVLRKWDGAMRAFRKSTFAGRILTSAIVVVVYLGLSLVFNSLHAAREYYPGVDPAIISKSASFSATALSIFTRAGATFGLLAGRALQLQGARWQVVGTSRQKSVRFIVGLIGVLLIWRGLAVVFPKGDDVVALGLRFLRYSLLSIWVVWGVPAIFLRYYDDTGAPRHPHKKGVQS